MTHTFKKAVSLLLSVLMLVSVCVCAFAETTESGITINDLGVSYVSVSQGDSTNEYKYSFTDVDGSASETVLMLNAKANGGTTIELADPEDNTQGFLPLSGGENKTYTLKFDYYVTPKTETGTMKFELKYGTQGAWDPNAQKVDVSDISYHNGGTKIGEKVTTGEWQTAYVTFKAIKVANDAYTAENQKLYLTALPSGSDSYVYYRNIGIYEETLTLDGALYENYTYDFKKDYFNEDGTVISSKFNGGNSGASAALSVSNYNTQGKYFVATPGANYAAKIGEINSFRYFTVLKKDGNIFRAKDGCTYAVVVKYKILQASETTTDDSTVAICTGDSSNSYTEYVHAKLYGSDRVDDKDGAWQYMYTTFTYDTATMTKNGNTTDFTGAIRIGVSGTSAKIAISEVQIAAAYSSNAVVNILNDNGSNVKVIAGYKDTPINEVGNNAYNTETLGEKFIGWYNSPAFTGDAVTTFQKSGTLYAKYPSVVLDFNIFNGYDSDSGTNKLGSSVTTAVSNGTMSVDFKYNDGFMLPSYDAYFRNEEIDKGSTTKTQNPEILFHFNNGTKYKITYTFKADQSLAYFHTYAINSGMPNGRGSDLSNSTLHFIAKDKYQDATFEYTHSDSARFGLKFRVDNYSSHSAGYHDASLDQYNRCTNCKAKVTFDKIIITEMSDSYYENGYLPYTVTLDYNDGTTAAKQHFIANGELMTLPVPERTGYIFAGWYKTDWYNKNIANNNTLGSATASLISADAIPLSFLVGSSDIAGQSYTAAWVKDEAVTIEFTEGVYENSKFTQGHTSSGEVSSAWYVDGGCAIYKPGGSNNTYKIGLWTQEGERLFVYEGVKYQITINYKSNGGSNTINVARAVPNGWYTSDLEGALTTSANKVAGYTPIVNNTATVGEDFETAKLTTTVSNSYRVYDGAYYSHYGEYANQLCLAIQSTSDYANESVTIDSVTVKALSYTPAYQAFDSTKGTVKIDPANKTVTATPNEGYEIGASGISVQMNYFDYTCEGDVVTFTEDAKKIAAIGAEKLGSDDVFTTNSITLKYKGDYTTAHLNALQIKVDFVAETETNASFIASSIRDASGEGETAISSGIRFRTRIAAVDAEAATKIEYIIVPEKALKGKTIEQYMALEDNSAAKIGIVKDTDSETDVVYANVGDYTDYAAVLTNVDGKLQELRLCVALRITKSDNTVKYIQRLESASYNSVLAKYSAN